MAEMTASEIAKLSPEDFTRTVWRLYKQALPDDSDPTEFNRLIKQAKIQRMTYVEGLLYVIENRYS